MSQHTTTVNGDEVIIEPKIASRSEIADILTESLDEFLGNSTGSVKQACITLFENEHEKGRAFVTANKSIQFNSRKIYSQYYQLSEYLRHKDDKEYRAMQSFIINTWP